MKKMLVAAGVVALVAGGVAIGIRPAAQGLTEEGYVPSTELPSGPEWTLVYLGASTCAACYLPGVREVVVRAKQGLAAKAGEEGRAFSAHGVALDWSVSDGEKFLGPYGAFDEISVGYSWMNSAAQHFIWKDLPGEPGIPQLILIERQVLQDRHGITVSAERVLERKGGADEIRAWARDGLPVRGF